MLTISLALTVALIKLGVLSIIDAFLAGGLTAALSLLFALAIDLIAGNLGN